jgi:hypothetical protein
MCHSSVGVCGTIWHLFLSQATVGTASYAAASDLGSIVDVADEEQLDARPVPEVSATKHMLGTALS